MKSTTPILLCYHDISRLPQYLQFILCVGGVFGFYLMYGYFQELIFNIPGFKPFGWYLTLVQFACYSAFAMIESLLMTETVRKISLQTYCLLAFLTVGTMGMSNSSLGYLNYPTQVIFKCCKLIPVMFGGRLIQGKNYGTLDFIACLLMSVGLTCFILADSAVQPKFHYIGVIFMCLALCSDAAIGNVQEKFMKSSNASNTEVVLYSYGIGFFYLFIALLGTGDLFKGFIFFQENAMLKYGYTIAFSLTGYLGITFVLTLIRLYGALVTVTVTTCRKAVTIILSFLLFSKPFTFQYVWSGLIVLAGIAINIYQKNRAIIDQKFIIFLHNVILHKFCVVRQKSRRTLIEV